MSTASAPLMTIVDVSAWLNVSRATAYRLCASGKLHHSKVSNAIRIAPVAVAADLEGLRQPSRGICSFKKTQGLNQGPLDYPY